MSRHHRARDRHAFGDSRRFAVECPGCRAHVAVAHELVGRAAGCPECRTAFLVPPAEREATRLPGAVEHVEDRPAPPAAFPVQPLPAEPPVAETVPSSPVAAGGGDDTEPPARAPDPLPARTVAVDDPIAFAEPPLPSTRRRPLESLPDVVPASTTPAADPFLPPLALEADGPSVAPPTADVTAAAADLAFQEPVRTVTSAGAQIELRRLTPEALRARRARRNLLILVVGAALLVALVVVLTSSRGGR